MVFVDFIIAIMIFFSMYLAALMSILYSLTLPDFIALDYSLQCIDSVSVSSYGVLLKEKLE